SGATTSSGKPPAIVPVFIIGFLLMVLLRSGLHLPEMVLNIGSFTQTALLSAAMFGLGTGVKVRNLLTIGPRPFILATISTIIVAGAAWTGIVISHCRLSAPLPKQPHHFLIFPSLPIRQ